MGQNPQTMADAWRFTSLALGEGRTHDFLSAFAHTTAAAGDIGTFGVTVYLRNLLGIDSIDQNHLSYRTVDIVALAGVVIQGGSTAVRKGPGFVRRFTGWLSGKTGKVPAVAAPEGGFGGGKTILYGYGDSSLTADEFQAASSLKPKNGEWYIIGHGADGQIPGYSAERLARKIKLSGWSGQRIRMIVCDSGICTSGSIASQLSRLTGTRVVAPRKGAWFSEESVGTNLMTFTKESGFELSWWRTFE